MPKTTTTNSLAIEAERVGKPKLLDLALSKRWALEPQVMHSLFALLDQRARGVQVEQAEIDMVVATRDEQKGEPKTFTMVGNRIAVIPVQGVIARHANQVNGVSKPRGTSVEMIRAHLRQARDDGRVEAGMLEIDSPGGYVDGLTELAEDLRDFRAEKPLYTHAEGTMASAAAWLGLQAGSVYATKGTHIGSIAVAAGLLDESGWYEQMGVRVHVITSADSKVAAIDGAPITQDMLDEVQREINALHEMFVEDIAIGRGWDAAKAASVADGRVHLGGVARKLGLVDEILSFEQAIARIGEDLDGGSSSFRGGAAASAVSPISQRDDEGSDEMVKTEDDVQAERAEREKAAQAARQEGAQAERARASAIRAMAHASQVDLAMDLIDQGASEDEARAKLHQDIVAKHDELVAKANDPKAQRLAEKAATQTPTGAGAAGGDDEFEDHTESSKGAAKADAKNYEGLTPFERACRAEWDAGKGQDEYDSFELYVAGQKNERRLANKRAREEG